MKNIGADSFCDIIACSTSNNANCRKRSSTSCRKLKRISTIRSKRPNGSIAGMPNPPEIQYAGSKAFYSSVTDRITLPPRELFISAEEQIATTYHEVSHATGHPKRLNRKSITEAAPFGSPIYATEEASCGNVGGVSCAPKPESRPAVLENQAAYIAGWLKKLRDDRKLVVLAAAQAQHAADYVLGKVPTAV